MEKFITKKLEKFVSDVQNSIFADRFRVKISTLNEGLGTATDVAVKFVIVKYRRTRKFVRGKVRTKRFLIGNINAFESEHNKIVYMIENGDVRDNWDEYLVCKRRVSAIIRANRRLNRMKVTNNENVCSIIHEHINQQRLAKKYELST